MEIRAKATRKDISFSAVNLDSEEDCSEEEINHVEEDVSDFLKESERRFQRRR